MKRCRHNLRHFDVAVVLEPFESSAPCGSFGPGWRNVVGQCRCESCGEVLSLGNSDEHASEQVEIEIRAARIGNEPPWGVVPDATQDEIDGWRSFDHLSCEPRPGHYAGYLARCITHDTEES